MKPIATAVHGFMDFLMGTLLIASPYLFELDGKNIDSLVFFVLGGTLLLYSLFTNYEMGMVKVIPMRVHLLLDVILGIFLALSPWIFGFSNRIFLPYLVLGIIEIVLVFLTNPTHRDSTRLI